MPHVPSTDRAAVGRNFENRCAYCRNRLEPGHPWDHVRPKALGGGDDIENLVPACNRCNTAKGEAWTPVRDPYRGADVGWFHPQHDEWSQHFKRVGSQVVGISPKGRAACSVLFRPLQASSTSIVNFAPGLLASDERLVEQIVTLIADQQEGKYQESLLAPDHLAEWLYGRRIRSEDRWLADFASHWVPAMAHWKRGTTQDLQATWRNSLDYFRRGRLADQPAHAERFRLEWVATNAILMATAYEDVGDAQRSTRFREFAVRTYRRIGEDPLINDPLLVYRAISNQMILQQHRIEAGVFVLENVQRQSETLEFQLGGDWVDAIVRSPDSTPYTVVEQAWNIVDDMMRQSSYGAGGDLAQSVGLRRRWWLLQCRLLLPVDLDLLSWDIRYWLRNGLRSEVRLLRSDLRRLGVHRDILDAIARPVKK